MTWSSSIITSPSPLLCLIACCDHIFLVRFKLNFFLVKKIILRFRVHVFFNLSWLIQSCTSPKSSDFLSTTSFNN